MYYYKLTIEYYIKRVKKRIAYIMYPKIFNYMYNYVQIESLFHIAVKIKIYIINNFTFDFTFLKMPHLHKDKKNMVHYQDNICI